MYKQLKKKKKTKKLHGTIANKTLEEEEKLIDYTKYRPHLVTYLEVNAVLDFTKYDKTGAIPREVFD